MLRMPRSLTADHVLAEVLSDHGHRKAVQARADHFDDDERCGALPRYEQQASARLSAAGSASSPGMV